MDRKSYQALIGLSCLLFSSCIKDKPSNAATGLPGASGNVYIVCEGNYGTGDASLYAYEPLKDSVFGDLYQNADHHALGDVFQSMQHIGNYLFLAINNSDKVIAIDAGNFKQSGSLSINYPRYILPISATKAYVTSEYSNKVYIINPQAQTVTGAFTLPYKNTEGMCLYNNYAFICCWDTACNKLYEIDVTTDQVFQAITLPGHAPQEVLLDTNQMLWVLAGDQPYGTTASLTRLDPSSGEIIMSYPFPADADPVKPVFNVARDTLYFLEAYNTGVLKNGVYRMDIRAATLPSQAFVVQQSFQYFWALGVSPADGKIYVADAKDFQQKGTVYIYQPDGTQKGSFNVGPGPGHFYFDE